MEKAIKQTASTQKARLRLIQSIPSKKAEPFKRWLAQVGQDRLDEIKNPEHARQRMKEIYEKKGWAEALFRNRIFWTKKKGGRTQLLNLLLA